MITGTTDEDVIMEAFADNGWQWEELKRVFTEETGDYPRILNVIKMAKNIQFLQDESDKAKAIQNMTQKFNAQLNTTQEAAKAKQDSIKTEYESAFQKTRDGYVEEINALKKASDNAITEAQQNATAHVNSIAQQYQTKAKEVAELSAEVKREAQEQINSILARAGDTLAQKEAMHMEEIAQLKASQTQELERVKGVTNKRISELIEQANKERQSGTDAIAKATKEKDDQYKAYKASIDELRDEIRKVDAAKANLLTEFERRKSTFANDLTAHQHELKKRILQQTDALIELEILEIKGNKKLTPANKKYIVGRLKLLQEDSAKAG